MIYVAMNAAFAHGSDLDHLYEQLFLFYYNNCTAECHTAFDQSLRDFFDALAETDMADDRTLLLERFVGACVTGRDPVSGTGRRFQSYLMILRLYERFPIHAEAAVERILAFPGGVAWEDIKYFTHFLAEETGNKKHPLVLKIIDYALVHLQFDRMRRWVPRENSGRYAWIFHAMRRRMGAISGRSVNPRLFRRMLAEYRDAPCPMGSLGRWSTERPGKLLRLMLRTMARDEECEDEVQDLEHRWSLIPRRSHKGVVILDLSEGSEGDRIDAMALAGILTHDMKRLFVPSATANWVDLRPCTGLRDYAHLIRDAQTHMGRVSANVGACVSMLQSAYEEACSSDSSDLQSQSVTSGPEPIIVMFANGQYNADRVRGIMDCWTNDATRPHFCFWNMCQTHHYQEMPCRLVPETRYDRITLVSGPHEMGCKDAVSGRTNLRRICRS